MKLMFNGEEVMGGGGVSMDEVYSTEETRIGTWIDGKPLYRKVLSEKFSATTGQKTIGNVTNGLKSVVNIYGFITRSDAGTQVLPMSAPSREGSIYIYAMGNNLYMYVDILASLQGVTDGQPYYVVVEYTKTTD